MRALVLAVLAHLAGTGPVAAAWELHEYTDQMTDRPGAWAELSSSTARASLTVRCLNGTQIPDISFPERLSVYEIGVNYRFDNGPVVPRIARVSTNGRDLWLWLGNPASAIAQIRKGKRLRVQVFTGAAEPLFFDFDLTDAGVMLNKVHCR
jgi:hypothetical protein